MKSNINIRFYTLDDFEQVIGLLKEAEMDTEYHPNAFGSKSFVAERNGDILGFIWIIAGDSPIVYIQDFAVMKKYHYKPPSKHPAPALLSSAMGVLKKQGYTHYVTNIEPHRKKILKMATQKLGGKDYGRQHLIGGSINEFLTKIQSI